MPTVSLINDDGTMKRLRRRSSDNYHIKRITRYPTHHMYRPGAREKRWRDGRGKRHYSTIANARPAQRERWRNGYYGTNMFLEPGDRQAWREEYYTTQSYMEPVGIVFGIRQARVRLGGYEDLNRARWLSTEYTRPEYRVQADGYRYGSDHVGYDDEGRLRNTNADRPTGVGVTGHQGNSGHVLRDRHGRVVKEITTLFDAKNAAREENRRRNYVPNYENYYVSDQRGRRPNYENHYVSDQRGGQQPETAAVTRRVHDIHPRNYELNRRSRSVDFSGALMRNDNYHYGQNMNANYGYYDGYRYFPVARNWSHDIPTYANLSVHGETRTEENNNNLSKKRGHHERKHDKHRVQQVAQISGQFDQRETTPGRQDGETRGYADYLEYWRRRNGENNSTKPHNVENVAQTNWNHSREYDRQNIVERATSLPDIQRGYPHRVDTQPPDGFQQQTTQGMSRANYQKSGVVRERVDETVVRRRIRTNERPMGISLIILAVLLLVLGVLNIIFCLDFYYYCQIWAGLLSMFYMLMCTIAGVATHVSVTLISWKLTPTIITLASYGNDYQTYINDQQLRDPPFVNISANARVWLCLSMDCSTVVLFIIGFSTFAAVAVVFDNYCSTNFDYFRKVEPFWKPFLANPYGQMLLAQPLSLLGIVSVFVAIGTNWQNIWSPVWVAGLVLVSGVVTAVSLKRPDKHLLAVVALILQLLAMAGCVAVCVFCILALVDNAKQMDLSNDQLLTTLGKFGVQGGGAFVRRWLIASLCFFAATVIMALVCLAWSMINVIRLVRNLRRRPDQHFRNYSSSTLSSLRTGFDSWKGLKDGKDWRNGENFVGF